MLSRHEEKYILTYAQYAILRQRALMALLPDTHGDRGTYTITSLYYDDPRDTGLYEKLDGLALHSKFRVRTYDHNEGFIKLERKDKQGILTQKTSAPIEKHQLEILTEPGAWEVFSGTAQTLVQEMQAKALRPVVGIRYVRDAFYHPGSDFRLTFDRNIEVIPPDALALTDGSVSGLTALAPGSVVMEIKYGDHLPAFARKLTRIQAPQLSLSKYALCREQIGDFSL